MRSGKMPLLLRGALQFPAVTASTARIVLVALAVVLGIVLRFRAVDANAHPHGDVHLDAITLDHFSGPDGRLITPIERAADYREQDSSESYWGYPADQHPPLALFFARAFAVAPTIDGGDAYQALQRGSLVAGILLIVAVALLALRIARQHAAFAVAATAGSFALADFSGNGAVYTLHAFFGVLALFAMRSRSAWASALCGGAIGLGYLTNYQALVFLPAAALAILVAECRGHGWRQGLFRVLGLGLGFALVAAPWWFRNLEVFGDPTYSVNPFYVNYRLGGALALVDAPRAGEAGLLLTIARPTFSELLGPLKSNLVVNARFVLSQAPWWVAALPLAAGALVFALRRREDDAPGDARVPALALFALAHLAIMLLWPACKFRYFVPLAPLVALLAAIGLERFDDRVAGWARRASIVAVLAIAAEMLLRGRPGDGVLVALTLALSSVPCLLAPERRSLAALAVFLATQVALYFASPTRTTYYDGLLVADAFGRRGQEAADRERQEQLARLPAELVARGVEEVVADVELAWHARKARIELRVIQAQDVGEPAFFARIVGGLLRQRDSIAVLVEGDDTLAAIRSLAHPLEVTELGVGRWYLARFTR